MLGKNWHRWELAGLFFVLAAGNLLHFVYDWSGQNAIVAAFAAVNESTWEHMKLLAVPWIVWSLAECTALGKGNALIARGIGLLVGLVAIPAVFYTYRGALEKNLDWLNILIFQLSAILAYAVSRRMQQKECCGKKKWCLVGFLLLVGVGTLFVIWSYHPPRLALFTDPLVK